MGEMRMIANISLQQSNVENDAVFSYSIVLFHAYSTNDVVWSVATTLRQLHGLNPDAAVDCMLSAV